METLVKQVSVVCCYFANDMEVTEGPNVWTFSSYLIKTTKVELDNNDSHSKWDNSKYEICNFTIACLNSLVKISMKLGKE